ncbi:hypothetical protein [Methanobrevibacter sp. UBA412]|jgi:hypothetical protein|uniref:hypothetical protein n=1 Tax=Methanobrevibacter sp. UBA412 TaxID=1915486 RepID=UPI0039B86D53
MMSSVGTQEIRESNLLNNLINDSNKFSNFFQKPSTEDNLDTASSFTILDKKYQALDYKEFLVQRMLMNSESLLNDIEKNHVLEDEVSNYLEIHNILNYILKDVNNVNFKALNLVDNILEDLKDVLIAQKEYFKDNNLENFKNIYANFESKFLDFQENYYTNYVGIDPDYKKTCVKVANVLKDTYFGDM